MSNKFVVPFGGLDQRPHELARAKGSENGWASICSGAGAARFAPAGELLPPTKKLLAPPWETLAQFWPPVQTYFSISFKRQVVGRPHVLARKTSNVLVVKTTIILNIKTSNVLFPKQSFSCGGVLTYFLIIALACWVLPSSARHLVASAARPGSISLPVRISRRQAATW